MNLSRPILFLAVCTDAGNAPSLTKGRDYRVVDQFDLDGAAFFNVLCDRGTLYAHPAKSFSRKDATA